VAEAIVEAEATQTATLPVSHAAATMLLQNRGNLRQQNRRRERWLPCLLCSTSQSASPRKIQASGITKYDAKQDPIQWLRCYALSIENAGGKNDTKCLYFPFCLDQAPLSWLESLEKYSIDKRGQLKEQFTSNFAGAMGRSGTRMDLAMVKQEQGETLHKYMRRFFDKRATVVDVTDKEVIDLFQDGLYQRRTFEDFGRRRPSSITHLKDMITSWADEEDKANTKYDAIHGKSKQNTGGNNNSNRHQGGRSNNYSGPNRKRKPDNTVATIQRPAKDNPKKTSGGFKDLLKEKCPWHLEGNHTTEQCYQLRRALKDTPKPRHPHDKKGKKKSDEGNGDFQEPDKTVNVLFGGIPTKRSQKATHREVLNIERAVPTPLWWSEVPISSRADQWTSFSEPVRFPLVLKPVVAGSRLNKVLIDGRSGLNVLFTKTLKKMKLDITHMLTKSTSLFYGIVPGNAAIPLGSVVLLVTFGETRENYRAEYIKFEIANFETSYHAILSRPAIAKFMAVPHYTYLVLKMPSPVGVLSL
jgi:hypothetical protein